MPLPLIFLVPAAAAGALVVYVKAHGAFIAAKSAAAAVSEYISSKDADAAAEAALRAGASAAAFGLVKDLFHFKI